MTERSGVEGSGAYWFEVSIDPPVGPLPSWKSSTWFVVRSISGLVRSIETTPVWEGGASGRQLQLPGKKSSQNLVLQGVVALKETSFFDWFESVTIGAIGNARADGLITLMNGESPAPVATWVFTGAFPVRYTGPTLDTHSSLLAFEMIELTHQSLERKS